MLNLQAKAAAATEEPDGRSVSELVRDGRHLRCVAGTSGHPGRFRRRASLLELFRGWSPGHFFPGSAGRRAADLGNVSLFVSVYRFRLRINSSRRMIMV